MSSFRVFARGAALAAALASCVPAQAQVQEPIAVDLELVFAADGSGSIDDDELKLQRQGYAEAIVHPRVLGAVRAGYLKSIAVAYIEWGAPESQHVIVDWSVVSDEASARAFAEKLVSSPRAAWGYNSISNAIAFSARMIAENRYKGTRRVIDVSGDGPQIGGRPLEDVRRETVAQGITINALVIDNKDGALRGPGGIPLVEHYERDVIGGHGAFVAVARDRERFAPVILRKMILEIADNGRTGAHP